jgi:hypothetical protein
MSSSENDDDLEDELVGKNTGFVNPLLAADKESEGESEEEEKEESEESWSDDDAEET